MTVNGAAIACGPCAKPMELPEFARDPANPLNQMSRKADPQQIRPKQIIRATIRCLARGGFSGLTMKRLAAEAGVSQGVLHYYFEDKRAILAAAAEYVMDGLDLRVAAE